MLVLRPSSAGRWVFCPGSVSMEMMAPIRQESDDAREGTAAHWLAEMVLTDQVGCVDELTDRSAPNGVVITGEMAKFVQMYIDHVQTRGGVINAIEYPIEFMITPDIKIAGTSDNAAMEIHGDTLYIDDLKYGWRIVKPQSWQLFCYMIGVALKAGMIIGQPGVIKRVVMTIVQPRPYHEKGQIRSWSLGWDEVAGYYETLKQSAIRIQTDTYCQTGEHCHYCDAFVACPAAQKAGMNAVDVANEALPDILSNEALAMEYRNLQRAQEVLKNRMGEIEDAVMSRIRSGAVIDGYGLKRKLGNSQFNNPDQLGTIEALYGVALHDKKPVTPAEAKRRGVPKEIVDSMSYRPETGLKIVPVDIDQDAKEMFNAN